MSKIKLLVVLVCMTLGFTNVVKGQIYESEACFYAEAGYNRPRFVLVFDGSNGLWSIAYNQNALKKDKDYYEKKIWQGDGSGYRDRKYEYVSNLSTSSRDVYRHYERCTYAPNCKGWYEYIAVSKDKSSFIRWVEYNPGVVSEGDKYTCTRIPKEDLLPQAANYDFLNE